MSSDSSSSLSYNIKRKWSHNIQFTQRTIAEICICCLKKNSSYRKLKKRFWLEEIKKKAEWSKLVLPLFCSMRICILELENYP